MDSPQGLTIGIDAVNIRRGGGLTHLHELLAAADPTTHGFDRIVIWATAETASSLPQRPWLQACSPPALARGPLARALWQAVSLAKSACQAGCDVLLVPGGTYTGRFRPAVVISQNLLPFDLAEIARFGFSVASLRLLALRALQSASFRRADAVVFLTEFAQRTIREVVPSIRGASSVIPHGIGSQFRMPPRQGAAWTPSASSPPNLIYVSTVTQYKHQWNVVEAVRQVRQHGYAAQLHLVGSAYGPALQRLTNAIRAVDPSGDWAHYRGPIQYEELHRLYQNADIGVFASSCENLPIILLEMMAASLPIVCSNRGPMPDILLDAGVYFDPEDPTELAERLLMLLQAPEVRDACAARASELARDYTWERCADQTFAFIAQVAGEARGTAG